MKSIIRNFAIGALASTAIAAASLAPVSATAANTTDQVVAASKSGNANPSLQLSQDGFNVIRDVRAARVAIFNGDTESAGKFVDQAREDLTKAKADDKTVTAKAGSEDANWIPIDGQLVVADNFVTTPEKAKRIAEGNKHFKEGKSDEAIAALKLADVDIGFTRVLMPLDATQTHVNAAADFIKNGYYYEANMALKAAEDGLNVETVMLVEGPKDKSQPATN